jgi:hypothetical protein
MFNPLSNMNVSTLGLDSDLLEAASKIKKESVYNSTCSMDDLKAEPSGSTPDAMKVNVAYEAKKKMKKEGVFGDQEPGGPKTYTKDNPV